MSRVGWELFDVESGNVVGYYPTRREVLSEAKRHMEWNPSHADEVSGGALRRG